MVQYKCEAKVMNFLKNVSHFKGRYIMEEKIEIMNLLQNKQLLEHELQSLAYGSMEIKEQQ